MTAYVLVVDDNWMNREVLETFLTTMGYRVGTASSGEKALEMVFAEPPDLVILDMRLGNMDGLEVCRRIRAEARTAHIAVVAFTALNADEDRQRALDAGVDDFLEKPFNAILMRARITSLLRIKRLHDALHVRLPALLAQHVTDQTAADAILRNLQDVLK